jgi:hypothetical protein
MNVSSVAISESSYTEPRQIRFCDRAPLIAEAPFAKKTQAGESNRARSNGPMDIVISWAASTPRRVHSIDR